jgi:HTH-type transcriptional regulator/antitoxin HigA
MRSMTKMNGKTNMVSTINITSTIRDAQTKSAHNILHLLVIKDKQSYKSALAVMEYLILNAPDRADNPYNDFMVLLGRAIETYEKEHYPVKEASGAEVLRFLMEQKNLKQIDLAPVLGTASIVCELLSGKRLLNKRQIEALSKHFKVSPAVFFA